jgi:two-component system chemotaxis response regulator CheY
MQVATQPRRVLVVDDSATVRLALAEVLRRMGYEVVQAKDGVDALALLEQHRFALVICDHNMPRMDGITLLEHLATRVDLPPPVVMLTVESDPALAERARLAGAKAWLMKPLRCPPLVAAVREFAA